MIEYADAVNGFKRTLPELGVSTFSEREGMVRPS